MLLGFHVEGFDRYLGPQLPSPNPSMLVVNIDMMWVFFPLSSGGMPGSGPMLLERGQGKTKWPWTLICQHAAFQAGALAGLGRKRADLGGIS